VLDGAQLFIDTMSAHVFTLFAGIQLVFDLVHRMTEAHPGVRARLLAGYGGHDELELVEDLWSAPATGSPWTRSWPDTATTAPTRAS
jgi:hypothetical protein